MVKLFSPLLFLQDKTLISVPLFFSITHLLGMTSPEANMGEFIALFRYVQGSDNNLKVCMEKG